MTFLSISLLKMDRNLVIKEKVKLKWKSVKNAKKRAITDLNAPNGSRDI